MGPSFGFGWGVEYEKSYANLIGNFYEKNNFLNIVNASVPDICLPNNYAGF